MVAYICEHGVKHGQKESLYKNEILPEFMPCDCFYRYGPAHHFMSWCITQYKLEYPVYGSSITEEMRQQYLLYHPPFKYAKKQGDRYLRKVQRSRWIEDRLASIGKEELVALKQQAMARMPIAVATGRAGPKFIKELTLALLCLKYECPY